MTGYYYDERKIANCRHNISKFDWAKAQCKRMTDAADSYLAKYSLEEIRALPPSQSMFRSYGVNQAEGCLVCGHKIDKFGNYPYKTDDKFSLFKIICPSCKTVFPSNDFLSYYRSALDENGFFCPEKGDKSLLVNTLYPEKGEKWGVDDGYGYVHTDGKKYTFVCYFTNWFLWDNLIINMVRTFSKAFLMTGDQKYGDAAIILLDRIADIYPTLSAAGHKRSEGYLLSDGCAERGKILGSIWDTGYASDLAEAVDAVRNALDTIGEKALAMIREGSRGARRTSADIESHLKENILRDIHDSVMRREIYGNQGMHQRALAMAAVAYDGGENTRDWLDMIFAPAKIENDLLMGMSTDAIYMNVVDRDGYGAEASLGYNSIWPSCFLGMTNVLAGVKQHPGDRYIYDLFKNPKFKKSLYNNLELIIDGKFNPHIGDMAATGNPGYVLNTNILLHAYLRYRDPYLARAVYFANGNKTDGLTLGIFEEDVEEVKSEIKEAVEKYGPIAFESANLTGYGCTVIKNNNESKENPQTALSVYYGRNKGHGHNDTLNTELFAYGMDLTPDLGYPEFCDGRDMHRGFWVNQTLSHNIVTVDDKTTLDANVVGIPTAYFTEKNFSESIKVFSVDAPCADRALSLNRRTVAMVRIDGRDSYVVDLLSVRGGKKHANSFHFAETDSLRTEGLSLVPQTDENGYMKGTLLSPDIAFGETRDKSGYQWLECVQKDKAPSDVFSADAAIRDTWGTSSAKDVHLKYTVLTKTDEAAFVRGIPPRNKPGNPAYLNYIYTYRNAVGDKPCESLFVSVLEPYCGESKIEKIERLPLYTESGEKANEDRVCAIRVTTKSGRVDTFIYGSDCEEKLVTSSGESLKGFFGAVTEENGKKTRWSFESEEVSGESFEPFISGTVESFTKKFEDENFVTVKFDREISAEALKDSVIYIDSRENTNAALNIVSAEALGDCRYKINIGNTTLILAYMDAFNPDAGFVYLIKEGQTAKVMLAEKR